MIDLDTIDISNLNRQFLFRREHVGKPKAEVASSAALRLNPAMKVSFLCDNVKNFDHSFVSRYDIVMSALDNIDARRHLNRICLTAGRPLIEAGCTGYMGQSRVIIKDISECYECQPKEAPKVYPVCTIRSSPSTPVHCIQWAKMMYELLFGPDTNTDSVVGDMHISSENPNDYLIHLFHDDIVEQIKLVDKWIEKLPPVPLKTHTSIVEFSHTLPNTTIHSLDHYVSMFLNSVASILISKDKVNFSKDDSVAVDFVAAASNLRMYNYHIPLMSRWDIESIAGAIVPAIATTNAIVAGLECFNLKALNGNPGRDLWVRYPHPSGNGSIVQSSSVSEPNKDCFICQNKMISVTVSHYELCSLDTLVRQVFSQHLSINDPMLIKDRTLIYDALEDDPDMLSQFAQSLKDWDFSTTCQSIQVEDSVTNETYHVNVSQNNTASELTFWVGDELVEVSTNKRQRLV